MAFESNLKSFLRCLDAAKNTLDTELLEQFAELLKVIKLKNKKILFFGNGGSAAMASHVSVDLMRSLSIKGMNFNEADLITCFSNDYGYEKWISETIKIHAEQDDLIVLISSSGESPNVLVAAEIANEMGVDLVTFTGFQKDNNLRKLGKMNFWADSTNYNVVEMTHHIWLLAVIECLIDSEK